MKGRLRDLYLSSPFPGLDSSWTVLIYQRPVMPVGVAVSETFQHTLASFQLWSLSISVKVCYYRYQSSSASLDLSQLYTYFRLPSTCPFFPVGNLHSTTLGPRTDCSLCSDHFLWSVCRVFLSRWPPQHILIDNLMGFRTTIETKPWAYR